MTPEPNRPDEREAALAKLDVVADALQVACGKFASPHGVDLAQWSIDVRDVLASLRRDAPREGASVLVDRAAQEPTVLPNDPRWLLESIAQYGIDTLAERTSDRMFYVVAVREMARRARLALEAMDTPDRAPREGASVDDAMVERALNAQPFAHENSANRVWQFIDADRDESRTIMRATLTAALADRAPRGRGEAVAPPERSPALEYRDRVVAGEMKTFYAALGVKQPGPRPQPAGEEGWRSMDSAPKDGTPVLCFHPGKAGANNENAREPAIKVDRFRVDRGVWWNEYPESRHTHWMPLPADPDAKEKAS